MPHKMKTNQLYTDNFRYGSGPSYAEFIKNVQCIKNIRKSAGRYSEEEIRSAIAENLQVPVEIVDESLCICEYINNSALATLAKAKASKHLFELIQKVKRILIKIYRHDEFTDEEITSKISEAVLKMHDEYEMTGKINTRNWQRFLKSDLESKNIPDRLKNKKRSTRKPKQFRYWIGCKDICIDRSVNIHEIEEMLIKISLKIANIDLSGKNKLRRDAEIIKEENIRLAKAYHYILELDRQFASVQQQEAA